MDTYAVTHTGKDRYGDITAIGVKCVWQLPADTAIQRIESGSEGYYVNWPEKRTNIHVARNGFTKYLRTDRDNTTRNNLDDLPSL